MPLALWAATWRRVSTVSRCEALMGSNTRQPSVAFERVVDPDVWAHAVRSSASISKHHAVTSVHMFRRCRCGLHNRRACRSLSELGFSDPSGVRLFGDRVGPGAEERLGETQEEVEEVTQHAGLAGASVRTTTRR